jgi:hypothetical protein
VSASVTDQEAEIERLRGRVAALEQELIDMKAWANEVVGQAQAQTYWLDRWHVDLNELMRHRSADRLRAAARAVRSVIRAVRQVKSRYRA